MKETYKAALIAEATATIVESHEDLDAEEVMEEVSGTLDGLLEEEGEEDWGTNFDEDVEFLVAAWEDEDEEVMEEEPSPEEKIQEAVDNLHVGFNFIPGLGFGYCKDEEDLAKMKEFVRGGMTVVQMMGAMMGI